MKPSPKDQPLHYVSEFNSAVNWENQGRIAIQLKVSVSLTSHLVF